MREDTCRFLRGQMARPLIIRDETRPVIARSFQLKPVGSAENLDENNVIGVDKSWRGFSRVRVNGRERIIVERGRRDANYRTSRGGHRR